jgi:hypothetical protein
MKFPHLLICLHFTDTTYSYLHGASDAFILFKSFYPSINATIR